MVAKIQRGIGVVERLATTTVTFTGAANLGQDTTAATVFTVTGKVLLKSIVAVCTTDLAGASATIDLKGADGYTFLGTTTSIDLDEDDTWIDTSPAETFVGLIPAAMKEVVLNADGSNKTIVMNSATADTTAGVLAFYAVYISLSADGSIS